MTRYFAQAEIDNSIYALYQYRYEDDMVFEDEWVQNTSSWETTTNLTRLFVGGDCTLTEISQANAMKAFPTAFPA